MFYSELFMPNFRERVSVAGIMTNAIQQQTGAIFRSGSEGNLGGFTSGTSADYAAGVDSIPLVYTIYAPIGGENGWDVPENQISRLVNEIFPGVVALADYVSEMPMLEP